MNEGNPYYQLFSKGDLSDYLLDRWELLQAELKNLKTYKYRGTIVDEILSDVKQRHLLTVPAVQLDSLKILRHGVTEPEDPEASAVPLTFAVIRLSFSGDPDLFHFRPLDSTLKPPTGRVLGREIHLCITRQSEGASAWEALLRQNLLNLDVFLARCAESVCGYNSSVDRELFHKPKVKPPRIN